ncbi:transketolase, partial [Campylobacter upsaliensis]|nr:transketolase [Campylobacter upsaliensis]
RPADGVENAKAWQVALKSECPSAFILSRQKLKALDGAIFGDVENGAYLLKEHQNPTYTLLASGSEVSLCLDVALELEKEGILCNVISMPCYELFERQDKAYKERLLKGKVIGVEAANSKELYQFCDVLYIIESFGESGKDKAVFEHFGFSVPKLCAFVRQI